MKITDLRLGNILSFVLPENICVVDSVCDELIGSYPLGRQSDFNAERGIESFRPVLINSEWLLKLGFVESSHNGSFEIRINLMGDGYACFNCFGYFLREVKYVHELQNLYFALTDEELIVSY